MYGVILRRMRFQRDMHIVCIFTSVMLAIEKPCRVVNKKKGNNTLEALLAYKSTLWCIFHLFEIRSIRSTHLDSLLTSRTLSPSSDLVAWPVTPYSASFSPS